MGTSHSFSSGTIETSQLQERIRLYLKILFLLNLAFQVVFASKVIFGWMPTPGQGPQPQLFGTTGGLTAFLGLCWYLGTRPAIDRTRLLALEGAVTVAFPAAFAILAMGAVKGSPHAEADTLPGMFIGFVGALTLGLRAAVVPSPMARTALVGVGTLGATTVITWSTIRAMPFGAALVLFSVEAASVAVNIVTSKVIYGLRKEVRAAKKLGPYELGRKIGEGGMGAVYEATHMLLRRPTALKLLPIDKVGEETVSRFEREVRQTSRLEHPNSVYIYDYGRTPDGQFYYAMEFLRGIELSRLVKEYGPQRSARVAYILRQAARALAEAHAMGLVHRDVKPANIMLCDRGLEPDTVKVLDFGLVKETTSSDGDLTEHNTILGTPHYMAPESIRFPESVGPPADVYALGGVAYYLLTGSTVFEATTPLGLCTQHLLDEPVPPSQREKGIEKAMEALVLKCLAKKPEDRFADGAELLVALDQLDLRGWDVRSARQWWDEHHELSDRRSDQGREQDIAPERTLEIASRRALGATDAARTQPSS